MHCIEHRGVSVVLFRRADMSWRALLQEAFERSVVFTQFICFLNVFSNHVAEVHQVRFFNGIKTQMSFLTSISCRVLLCWLLLIPILARWEVHPHYPDSSGFGNYSINSNSDGLVLVIDSVLGQACSQLSMCLGTYCCWSIYPLSSRKSSPVMWSWPDLQQIHGSWSVSEFLD